MSELTHCCICGCALEDEAECYEVENEILCQDCYDNETVVCDHCGERCIEQNTVSDRNTILCTDCLTKNYLTKNAKMPIRPTAFMVALIIHFSILLF